MMLAAEHAPSGRAALADRPLKHFQRIADGVNVAPVLAELAASPQHWDAHRVRKDTPGSPHSRMSDWWCRYNDVRPFEAGEMPWSRFNGPHLPVFYPGWYVLPSLHPIVFDLMALPQVRGLMLCGIIITRIEPGAGIDRHLDRSWHVDFTEKFYLALQNAPGARFICSPDGEEPEALKPEPGSIWRFDNRKHHSVVNESDQDRLTAIICIHTEKLEALA